MNNLKHLREYVPKSEHEQLRKERDALKAQEEDIFEELIRIRDEMDWGGIDKLLREYARG